MSVPEGRIPEADGKAGRRLVGAGLSRLLAVEYTAGATLKELAERYGLKFNTVRQRAIDGGATMRPRARAAVFEAPKTLAEEYTAGASLRDLAEEYRVSYSTIRRWLAADPAVTLRDPSPYGQRVMNGAPRGTSAGGVELSRQLAAEYADGASLSTLSDRYGLACNTIRDYVIAAGGTMRPPGCHHRFTAPETLAEEYAAGASIRELAERHGAKLTTMRSWLVADPDVTLRRRGNPAGAS